LWKLYELRGECSMSDTISTKSVAKFVVVPIVIFIAHCIFLGLNWIIDDAGISFAYAKNLANGNGLVAQSGGELVEGFSNPLWVFLFSPIFYLNLFHLYLTPKFISIFCVIISFLLISRSLIKEKGWSWIAVYGGLSLLSIQPAFVIWSVSGLENPLTVLLTSLLLVQTVKIFQEGVSSKRTVAVGLVSGFLSLTRPDSILYLLFFPCCVLIGFLRGEFRIRKRTTLLFISSAVLPVGLYLVFRYFYYGDIFPNTYYAKGGPNISHVTALVLLHASIVEKIMHLASSIMGVTFSGWFVVLSIALCIATVKKWNMTQWILFVGVAISAVIYLLMPYDWMPEFRFATSFFMFFYLFVAGCCCIFIDALRLRKKEIPIWFWCITIIVIGTSVTSSIARSVEFKLRKPIPIYEVLDTGDRFVSYAKMLETDRASLLIADVGGLMLKDELQVYDLGMLCNKTIAKTLGEGATSVNVDEFHEYIFETARPIFIATRAYHSWIAKLYEDARFYEQYVPIFEYEDQWILGRYGQSKFSGDYIRKDVVQGKKKALLSMKEDAKNVPYAGSRGK